MDTIFALATAPGKAGVAVIRISGPDAWRAGEEIAGALPPPREAGLRKLRSKTGGLLDEALVLVFEKGKSFTGEESVEFQTHGSIAVVASVMSRLAEISGLRAAEAGEFTRRALENGMLDLTQVEALSDLIEAETEEQRKQATLVLSGGLSQLVDAWRKDVIRAASLLEATIDFADEEVPIDVSDEVRDLLMGVLGGVETQLQGLKAAERVRLGFEVAIVGPPNAGKSTLLNYLSGREAAITSEIAGTTRDVIEVRMEIAGLPVTLLDTAGLRETDDVVETIGVDRAKQRAMEADLRIHLLGDDDVAILDVLPGDIVVRSKMDQRSSGEGISGLTGEGVSEMVEILASNLKERTAGAGVASRIRHRRSLELGRDHLSLGLSVLEDGPDFYEIASEEIRIAARAMSSLLGYVDVEDLLDEIFTSFCVGK